MENRGWLVGLVLLVLTVFLIGGIDSAKADRKIRSQKYAQLIYQNREEIVDDFGYMQRRGWLEDNIESFLEELERFELQKHEKIFLSNITQESRWNPHDVSVCKARGLGQTLPKWEWWFIRYYTDKGYRVSGDTMKHQHQLAVGAFGRCLQLTKGDVWEAVRYYNGGHDKKKGIRHRKAVQRIHKILFGSVGK